MEHQEKRISGEPSGSDQIIRNPQYAIRNEPGFIPLSAIQSPPSARLDADTIRQRLSSARGREYWRSLDELADSEEFQRYLEKEFPEQAPRDMSPLSRREFFRVMGATLALAGVAGCSYQPPENIVPYVEQPERLVPGKPLFFTTAFQRGGYAYGVLGESHMGRPTKLEGNPQHPASMGATDPFIQASLLTLYDPDRSQSVRRLGDLTTWDVFLGELGQQLPALRQRRGAGLRIVTETITSPSLAAQMRRLLARYPGTRVYQHEPAGRDNIREGARRAFGNDVQPLYHFDRAQRIFSLDSNFLVEEPGSVRYAWDLVVGGRLNRTGQQRRMNRLYAVESTPTITGAYADHRLPLRPSQIEPLARAVASALGAGGGGATAPAGVPQEWIDALVRDLQSHRGTSLVVPGVYQPPVVHALAHAMNQALGNIGTTVTFVAPVEVSFGNAEGTLRELVDDMRGGRVEMLVILGANPVYTAPAELKFGEAMQAKAGDGRELVPLRVHLGLYDDETGVLCHWHLPESHYLEAWGDARAYDGTVSIIQPLIQPLYASQSAPEFLAALLADEVRSGYDIVRAHWQGQDPRFAVPTGAGGGGAAGGGSTTGGGNVTAGGAAQGAGGDVAGDILSPQSPAFERFWHQALTSGVVPGTASPSRNVTPRSNVAAAGSAPAAGGMEIVFRPDPTLWDGRFANNAWLQELPKPLTHLTWDNAALISPATAKAQNLQSKDMVRLSYGGRELEVPVWVVPGHPDETVTLYLGYGRTRAGRIGNNTGFNAYLLRTSESPWFGTGLEMRKVGGSYKLANSQRYVFDEQLKGRNLVRAGTYDQLTRNPSNPEFMHMPGHGAGGELPSLLPPEWPSDRKPASPPTGGAQQEETVPVEQPAVPGPGDRQAPVYEGTGYNGNPIPQWGMVIDTNACIGCNACVIACQAENNIATVGKDEVARNREMHWIRIDTYYLGQPENPETLFQPIPCMHCEKAPCEPVCPVEATSHSAEGINEQTYNRCVGTRYCENNCPYKVRRFNYFQYSDQKTPTIQLMRNPDVTVRSRGVMEKCTYCIQRINQARIEAEKEERPIRDGDVITACAQSCPTQAIVFGNINDLTSHNGRGSLVRQLKADPLNFGLLTELNTRPRTSYLAKLRNAVPELRPSEGESGTEGH